jgi:hypothetical protein
MRMKMFSIFVRSTACAVSLRAAHPAFDVGGLGVLE